MPTNEERHEVATKLLNCASLSIPSPIPLYLKKAVHGNYPHWTTYSDSSTLERLASLIEPEPMCIANITLTAEQQEELFQRVMEELRVNGCPNCDAKVVK